MSELTKRLQILLSPEQYRKLELYAKKRKKSVASVIREAIEKLLHERTKLEKKKAVERMLSRELPIDDWEKMEEEIMKGAIL
ncbi:MAG: ribbon-helix-helix protein, CopG family [Actinomycetota bacterium]|nr:ribbon-helix-helix protein, CopG family [Actinomycetota bacterium]